MRRGDIFIEFKVGFSQKQEKIMWCQKNEERNKCIYRKKTNYQKGIYILKQGKGMWVRWWYVYRF